MDGVWKDAGKSVSLFGFRHVFSFCSPRQREMAGAYKAVIGFLLIIVTNLAKTSLHLTFIVTKMNFACLLFS